MSDDDVQRGLATTPDVYGGIDDDFTGLSIEWLRTKPGVKWRGVANDVLPAWIAEMDFPTPEPVRRALRELVDGADLGYPAWPAGSPLRAAFAERMRSRFRWSPDVARVRETNEIVQGAQLAVLFGTNAGDAVAIHTPCYPPLLTALRRMGRQILPIPMIEDRAGWMFEPLAFEQALRRTGCRALLLVNPHNPTGRAFNAEELSHLADLARRHDLLVIADEIHADLTYAPHQHHPIAGLNADMAARTVTLYSASKAFNLAGTRCAVAHIGPDRLLTAWDQQPGNLYGRPNLFGVTATLAAWQDGDSWLTAVGEHLDHQRHLLADLLARDVPDARYHLPQAGYLAWIDFRELGLGPDPADVLLKTARVALQSGLSFGPGSDGFARLNFATSPGLLQELVGRISRALNRARAGKDL